MKTHVALLMAIGCITVTTQSQTPEGLEGKWEVAAGPNQLRVVLNITRASDGLHLGTSLSRYGREFAARIGRTALRIRVL
jgi:hypothetical protein